MKRTHRITEAGTYRVVASSDLTVVLYRNRVRVGAEAPIVEWSGPLAPLDFLEAECLDNPAQLPDLIVTRT